MSSLRRFAFEQAGDGLAVADCLTNEITLLNASAAVVWLSLDEGPRSIDTLVTEMEQLPAGASATTRDGLLTLLQAWQDLGWVTCDGSGRWHLRDLAQARPARRQDTPAASAPPPGVSAAKVVWRRGVALSGASAVIEVRALAGMDRSEDILRLAGFLNGLPGSAATGQDAAVSLIAEAGRMHLLHDGQVHQFRDVFSASAPFNLAAVRACYPDHVAHTIVHAAAVCRETGSIILPAVSGSGKTTLTAFLTVRGWQYAGDDIIGLGRRPVGGDPELLPFPTALGIKVGAANILTPDYPELATAPVVSYGDKHVRFISVAPARLPGGRGEWHRPRALVFPQYVPQAPCELMPLTEWDALELLLTAGTGAGTGTDLASFSLLMELITSVPRYRMRYGSLDDAAARLEGLV